MESDLASTSPQTPVFLFCHDPPGVETKHLTHPNGARDFDSRDGFENLLPDRAEPGATIASASTPQQRALAAFLRRHRNIVAYFHGHAHWNEFYIWSGPDGDLALHTFRVDSPMKGKISGADETKLSFQVAVCDVASLQLTVRECRWNAVPDEIAWGDCITVSIARRNEQPSSSRMGGETGTHWAPSHPTPEAVAPPGLFPLLAPCSLLPRRAASPRCPRNRSRPMRSCC